MAMAVGALQRVFKVLLRRLLACFFLFSIFFCFVVLVSTAAFAVAPAAS
jgi:hypothetical protein